MNVYYIQIAIFIHGKNNTELVEKLMPQMVRKNGFNR